MKIRIALAVAVIFVATASAGSPRAAPKGEENLAARIDYLLDRIEALVVRGHRPGPARSWAERVLVAPVVAPEGDRDVRDGR